MVFREDFRADAMHLGRLEAVEAFRSLSFLIVMRIPVAFGGVTVDRVSVL